MRIFKKFNKKAAIIIAALSLIMQPFVSAIPAAAIVDVISPNMGAISAKTRSTGGGTTIAPTTWQADNDPYFYWNEPSDTSGIKKYWFAMDNATPETSGTGTTDKFIRYDIDTVSDGKHMFYVRAEDNAGNKSGTVGSFAIWVDTANPTATTVIDNSAYGPSSYVSGTTIKGTASDDSGINSLKISIVRSSDSKYWDGSDWKTSYRSVSVAGTTTWTYSMNQSNFSNGVTYTITPAEISDTLRHVTSAGTADSFVWDSVAPTIVNASSTGKTYIIADMPSKEIKLTFSEVIANTPTIGVNPPPIEYQTVNNCSDADAKTFCFNYAIVSSQETTHRIYVSGAQDTAGNVMAVDNSFTFAVDTKAPTTSYSINPSAPNGDNDWYKGTAAPVISLTTESGATIHWQWESEGWNSGSTPQGPIVTEGTRTLEYYSVDATTNEETPHKTVTIKHDGTNPPVWQSGLTTSGCAGFSNGRYGCADSGALITVYLSGSDTASGISKLYYSLDNVNFSEYTDGIQISNPTSKIYDIYYYGTDLAGNSSAVQTYSIDVDADNPTVTLDSQTTPTNETVLRYTGNAKDAYSGINYIEYEVDSGGFTNVTNFDPATGDFSFDTPTLTEGNHYVMICTYDMAINKTCIYSDYTYIDLAKPVITLAGDAAMDIQYGGTYTEQGAVWADGIDGTGDAVIGGDAVDIMELGTYTITYDYTDKAGNAAAQITRTINVVPRKITVTANPQTKIYGTSDTKLIYTSDPLIGTDNFTGELEREVGENIGKYEISQGTLALNANYEIKFISNNLEITKAPITITADNKTKVAGASDPVFTYKVTSGSLVGADTFSGNLTRPTGETAGTYQIQAGSLKLSDNYELAFVPGVLTITAMPAGGVIETSTSTASATTSSLNYDATSENADTANTGDTLGTTTNPESSSTSTTKEDSSNEKDEENDSANFFTNKILGVFTWVWLLIIAAGIGIWWLLASRRSENK